MNARDAIQQFTKPSSEGRRGRRRELQSARPDVHAADTAAPRPQISTTRTEFMRSSAQIPRESLGPSSDVSPRETRNNRTAPIQARGRAIPSFWTVPPR